MNKNFNPFNVQLPLMLLFKKFTLAKNKMLFSKYTTLSPFSISYSYKCNLFILNYLFILYEVFEYNLLPAQHNDVNYV